MNTNEIETENQRLLAELEAKCPEKLGKPGNAGDSTGKSLGNSRELGGNPTEIPAPLPKNHSVLHSLPAYDQRIVLNLLDVETLSETKRTLALPRPVGLGIRVSISALQRFHADFRADEVVDDHDIAVEQAKAVLELSAETDIDFIKAAKHLLKIRLLKTSVSPTAETAEIRDLFRILDRLHAMDLAERKQQLAEQKHSK